jgi:hypothetical protein
MHNLKVIRHFIKNRQMKKIFLLFLFLFSFSSNAQKSESVKIYSNLINSGMLKEL